MVGVGNGRSPIKSHHIIAVLREYGIENKSVRVPNTDKFIWGFSRAALDDAFARYIPSPPIHPPAGKKSASRPHSVENVDENTKNANPHGSPTHDHETSGETCDYAGFNGNKGEKPPNPRIPLTLPTAIPHVRLTLWEGLAPTHQPCEYPKRRNSAT